MRKKTWTGLVALLLVFSLTAPAFAAAADVPLAEQALVLGELEIMVGDAAGDLHLDAPLNRAELTKLMVAASPLKGSVGTSVATDPYPDVPHTSWAAPWVQTAVSAGYVKGNLKGYFEPNRAVTLAESATMALRLLGYSDSDFSQGWPGGQMALYHSLKLDVGIAADPLAGVTRGDALHLLYNLLTVKTKAGAPYLSLLGHTLNGDGEVDLEALLELKREGPVAVVGDWKAALPGDPDSAIVYRDNERSSLSALEAWDTVYWAEDGSVLWAFPDSGNVMNEVNAAVAGPVIATGDWEKSLPYSLAQSSVTRNGRAATSQDILENDVVYWNKHAQTVYAYSEKITGMVEAVSPSLASPTAITVSGTSYPLETSAAAFACSDLGTVRKGDTVTLLLGRTNGVAAITPPAETDAPLVGLITAMGTATYTDEQNKPYTAKTVTLTTTDGASHVYRWAKDNVEAGDLARVTHSAEGATVEKQPEATFTGKFSADGTTLGGVPLAEGAELLDTFGDSFAMRVYPTRLASVKLSDKAVRYYEENTQGEITRLILRDATGDLHQYGVLTAVTERSQGMVVRGDYAYLLGGTLGRAASDGKLYNLQKGPFCLRADGSLNGLIEAKGATVDGNLVRSGSKTYPLSSTATAYIQKDDTFLLSTLAIVTGTNYTLSAYYDKLPQDGGLVRVLVAKEVKP